jgi:hypothetical protein
MREKIAFEPNIPVTVTLQYAEGKLMDGHFGQSVMYSLEGNRVMFLDLAVSQKINMLEPAVGESFLICKRSGLRGQPVRWDVWLSPETEKFRAQKEHPGAAWTSPPEQASQLQRDLEASLAEIQRRKQAVADDPIYRRTDAAAPPPQGTGTNGPAAIAAPGPVAVPRPAPVSKLEDALKTVISAVFAAQEHAKQIGYAAMPQFSSEDIRTMANTLIIDGKSR